MKVLDECAWYKLVVTEKQNEVGSCDMGILCLVDADDDGAMGGWVALGSAKSHHHDNIIDTLNMVINYLEGKYEH